MIKRREKSPEPRALSIKRGNHLNAKLEKFSSFQSPQTSDSPRTTFSSLKHRNFRLYFFTQLISNSGNWLTNVALTLLMLKLKGTGLSVGLLAACQYGPIFILTAWGGAIADRVDKRKALLLTQTLEMLQSCALAVLAFHRHPPVTALYLVALIGGILLSFDNPLRRSFVSEMVAPEDIPNAVVMYSTIVNFSRIIGPILAGALASAFGFGWCFTVDAISYATVISGIIAMRPSELFRGKEPVDRKRAIRTGIAYIFSQRDLTISLLMLTIIGIFSYNFTVTLPLFTRDSLHRSTSIFTLIYSLYGVGSVFFTFVIAKRKMVSFSHIVLGSIMLGVTMIFLAISPNLIFAVGAAFLTGCATILFSTSMTTYLQINSKKELVGRVLAIQMVLTVGTVPIGGPLLGWVADKSGGRTPLLIGAIAALIAGAAGYLTSRRIPATNSIES
jgi:MFS family permease